jgi:hypothetical protein
MYHFGISNSASHICTVFTKTFQSKVIPRNHSSFETIMLFSEEFQNFNFIANIPVVERSHESPELHTRGLIPVFNGIELSLSNMGCFSIWNKQGTLLPNIRKLCLLYCDHLISLREMPRVKSVGIKHCSHLQSIPSLNSLTCLMIFNFAQPLKLPAEFPMFNQLTMSNCKSWSSYDFAHRFRGRAYLCFIPISDLSPLKNTQNLVLHGVNSLASLQGLEGDETETVSSVDDQRYICLADLNQMTDFSFCKNIWQLALVQLPHFSSDTVLSSCCKFHWIGNQMALEVNNMPFFKITFEEYKKDPTTHQDILGNIDNLFYSDETTNIEHC